MNDDDDVEVEEAEAEAECETAAWNETKRPGLRLDMLSDFAFVTLVSATIPSNG